MSRNLFAKSINQYNIFYETVSITFLWNFCHLFPVLFYDWNTIITQLLMTVSNFPIFQGFLLGINFWKGISLFNGDGSLLFGWGGGGCFIFKWGGMVDICFDGRRGSKKIIGLGEGCPLMPPLWETLHIIIIIIIIVTIIIITIQPYRVSGHNLLKLLQKAQTLKN